MFNIFDKRSESYNGKHNSIRQNLRLLKNETPQNKSSNLMTNKKIVINFILVLITLFTLQSCSNNTTENTNNFTDLDLLKLNLQTIKRKIYLWLNQKIN
jgi:hypothetical protein